MKIRIYDEFSPEDVAMMQALYSRSAASVDDHVEKVRKAGSGKFMGSYYVSYGHASIGDCGTTTIFIEGVSMFVAKAIQDWNLYSGQETSSRYIDMAKQGMVDPAGTALSRQIQADWMAFYVNNQERMRAHLKAKYPMKPGEEEKVYEKAINARIFDTFRSFLPGGSKTQLSWHTNLRQAHDHLVLLRYHPLAEVREVAAAIHAELKAKYPSSFMHKEYPEQEAYRKMCTETYTFYNEKKYAGDFKASTNIKWKEVFAKYGKAIKKRPVKTNLPTFLAEYGTVTFDFLLDFGSFRDVQRHRNGVCRMPLVTTKHGFNEWYLSELSPELRKEAEALIKKQVAAIKKLAASGVSKEDLQYYIAMGFNITCHVAYGLPATIYTMELRSGSLVHPSLRKIAHKMHGAMKKMFPGLVMHPDLSASDWDVRRGKQDIVEKK